MRVRRDYTRNQAMGDPEVFWGVLVLEQSSDTVLAESEGWVLFDRRVYGKTALGFYAFA